MHTNLISIGFKIPLNFPAKQKMEEKYIMEMVIIASSPRVGSSLISDLLTQAEAGYVAEHFNLSVHVPKVVKEKNLINLNEHFNFITNNYKNSNGNIFTVKCHFDQFFNYSQQVDIFKPFQKIHFIHIKRNKKQNQYSLAFMEKKLNAINNSNLAVQRDSKTTKIIKDKIHPLLGSLPKISLIDQCLSFNNNFYGYIRRS
ncbi:hypothetical protein [Billgrantia bachuensis]|uniref:hypothetical protein n=1 Tax=Billgrantia bachuensis TaxID=2717286 RepID=UPI00141E932A|nr:hypothetical protein [Halomonas bachuensis]